MIGFGIRLIYSNSIQGSRFWSLTMSYIQPRALPRLSSASLVLLPSPRIQTQITRLYATQSNIGSGPQSIPSRKKSITVLSDDGRVQWGDLSRGEKVARATQQSFNFVIVLAGAVLTVWSSFVRGDIANHRWLYGLIRAESSHFSISRFCRQTARHGNLKQQ